jgi:hypothetical protein
MTTGHESPKACCDRNHRGPLLYFAVGGLVGAAAAVPLVAAIPITADPNPLGYLLVLLGVPIGGLVYRLRSRHWPIDRGVRPRQIRASLATLLLPGAIAVMTGMRGPKAWASPWLGPWCRHQSSLVYLWLGAGVGEKCRNQGVNASGGQVLENGGRVRRRRVTPVVR